MKKVLVTGASGFLGKASLACLAKRGFEVHALSSRANSGKRSGAIWHEADLMDPEAVSSVLGRVNPSHLLHFAWYTEHGKFWAAAENHAWKSASIDLLRAFKAAGGQRAVFAGTCAEYEWGGIGPLEEGVTPLRPASLYGTSKLELLEMVQSYAAETGLSAAWGRIFFLFGPGEKPERLVPSVIRSLLKGEEAVCSNGGLRRDFLYAEDVADAFAHLLDSSVLGPVNIGSGQAISLKALVEKIGEKMGAAHLLRFAKDPPRPGEAMEIVASNKRLSEDLGWRPILGLDVGLKKTIEWWRENENHD